MFSDKPIYYDEVDVGDEIPTLQKKPTLEQVKAFCRAYGIDGPSRFTDAETARQEGVPDLIIPGIMSMAYLSQLVTDWAPNISLKRLDVIFRAPVLHEEAIECKGLITDKEVRDGENCVDVDLYVENNEGRRAVTGNALVVIPDS
jgi:acyl dehydratase